jgi:guanylate kinase
MARRFAVEGETDDLDQVLLRITMENETGKHYFFLDRAEFTNYPDEQEVLLQAGLMARVISVTTEQVMAD